MWEYGHVCTDMCVRTCVYGHVCTDMCVRTCVYGLDIEKEYTMGGAHGIMSPRYTYIHTHIWQCEYTQD
jgi:hypothetical protein